LMATPACQRNVPWNALAWENVKSPHAPLEARGHKTPCVNGSAAALPPDIYWYDIAFDLFKRDYEFRQRWHVVGCARHPMEDCLPRDKVFIRVLVDLAPGDPCPTEYVPGAAPAPLEQGSLQRFRRRSTIPGLPTGYAVPLDVHFLAGTRAALHHQRTRRGKIDPKLEWVHTILSEMDGSQVPSSRTSSRSLPSVSMPKAPNDLETHEIAHNVGHSACGTKHSEPVSVPVSPRAVEVPCTTVAEACANIPIKVHQSQSTKSLGRSLQNLLISSQAPSQDVDEFECWGSDLEVVPPPSCEEPRTGNCFALRGHEAYNECVVVSAFGHDLRLVPNECIKWDCPEKEEAMRLAAEKREQENLKAGKLLDLKLQLVLLHTSEGE